jgi:hypothetical protein
METYQSLVIYNYNGMSLEDIDAIINNILQKIIKINTSNTEECEKSPEYNKKSIKEE